MNFMFSFTLLAKATKYMILKMNLIDSKNKTHRVFLLLLVSFSIFHEKSCHCQFYPVKIGRQEVALLKETIQDFVQDEDELDFELKVNNKLIELN